MVELRFLTTGSGTGSAALVVRAGNLYFIENWENLTNPTCVGASRDVDEAIRRFAVCVSRLSSQSILNPERSIVLFGTRRRFRDRFLEGHAKGEEFKRTGSSYRVCRSRVAGRNLHCLPQVDAEKTEQVGSPVSV